MTANISKIAPRLFGDHYLLSLEPNERILLEHVRKLCHSNFGPQAAEVASQDIFAWETFQTLAREGIVSTAFPVAYGGIDSRQVVRIRIIEELARVCSTSASIITGTDLSSRAIVSGASLALKQTILPKLCSGEQQSAFALSEPAAGSDVRGLTTVMRRTEDGYVITGQKKYITRASSCLLYTSPSPRDRTRSRMPSSA